MFTAVVTLNCDSESTKKLSGLVREKKRKFVIDSRHVWSNIKSRNIICRFQSLKNFRLEQELLVKKFRTCKHSTSLYQININVIFLHLSFILWLLYTQDDYNGNRSSDTRHQVYISLASIWILLFTDWAGRLSSVFEAHSCHGTERHPTINGWQRIVSCVELDTCIYKRYVFASWASLFTICRR